MAVAMFSCNSNENTSVEYASKRPKQKEASFTFESCVLLSEKQSVWHACLWRKRKVDLGVTVAEGGVKHLTFEMQSTVSLLAGWEQGLAFEWLLLSCFSAMATAQFSFWHLNWRKWERKVSRLLCWSLWWIFLADDSFEFNRSCSDITNTLVGISGETDPGGGNLLFYWVHSGAIWQAVVPNSQLVCHTTLLPHQGAVASAIL